jgi:RNA polymerase sigma factor (TIGR02999 family)
MRNMTDMPSAPPDDEDLGSWSQSLPPAISALADELVPFFYDELKRVARNERYRVGAGATMQTTALVNEAYLKLRSAKGWNDNAHFLRAAALAMRHALVNHAAAHLAIKRGSGAAHLSLTAAENVAVDSDETLVAINEAIERLAEQSPRLAQVVECRYFGGYDDEATARALNLSARTVRRDWALARAWLHREVTAASTPGPEA